MELLRPDIFQQVTKIWLPEQDSEGGSRGHNDCSLRPIQPHTAGASDTKCAKDTTTDRDHAQNARERA